MTDNSINENVTLRQQEKEGLRLMLNTGARLVNRALFKACREAYKRGATSVDLPTEYIDWRKGEKQAKGFIERAGI